MSEPEIETKVSKPLLEARGITRSYGSVAALSGVDLMVRPGEVRSEEHTSELQSP